MDTPLTGTMRALIKERPEPGIWMGTAPIPVPGPDEVLIRVHKTAICGTDIHIFNWDEWAAKTIPVPMTVGHEYAGVVVGVGAHVKHFEAGQRVTGEGHIVGRWSRNARAGKYHLSPDTVGVGVNRPGAFAEYLTLPEFNTIALPDHVPDDIAAILDPFGNATHATLSFDLVGEDVLITGAGPIGIMSASIARHAGAKNVVITDVNDFRLELASKMADVRPVNVEKEDVRDVQHELGMTEGFDVGLEMSGRPEAFDCMIDNMIMGGRIALLGLPPGKTQVDWSTIILKAITIKGIYGREMYETWYKMFAMLKSGMDISPIITHRYDVEDFAEAFEVMRSGKSGKVILDWPT